tara:strand:+ start:840 stop:1052 length:213 start_codon:yes stop_codon:yes gene_type:complete
MTMTTIEIIEKLQEIKLRAENGMDVADSLDEVIEKLRGGDEDALMMDYEYDDDGMLDDSFAKYLNTDAPY